MPLDLLVPDLLLPSDAPAPLRATRMPALEKWLARANLRSVGGTSAASWLAAAYELPSPPPVAAISRIGEGAWADGAWMRADPVHLRIDHDYLKLHDASILDVRRDEADALIAALQAHFRQDGLEFHAASPDRWYVSAPEGVLPRTTPLEAALGRDVFGLLPANTAVNWRSAITEAQMVMGAHDVNAQREAQGKLAINSVWFWGEGTLPAVLARPYSLVCAGEPLARGLGIRSGAEVRPVPASLADLDLVASADSALVVIDSLTAPLRRGDVPAWQASAAALDEHWFALLGDAIERFGSVRLVLPAGKEVRVATLTPAAKWRWYRARKPLATHA
jgi:hypothetical protein